MKKKRIVWEMEHHALVKDNKGNVIVDSIQQSYFTEKSMLDLHVNVYNRLRPGCVKKVTKFIEA